MTRKDYVAIAQAFVACKQAAVANTKANDEEAMQALNAAVLGINNAAHFVAWTMEKDNSRFDTARFLKACGISAA